MDGTYLLPLFMSGEVSRHSGENLWICPIKRLTMPEERIQPTFLFFRRSTWNQEERHSTHSTHSHTLSPYTSLPTNQPPTHPSHHPDMTTDKSPCGTNPFARQYTARCQPAPNQKPALASVRASKSCEMFSISAI